jgi:hypothetical protein
MLTIVNMLTSPRNPSVCLVSGCFDSDVPISAAQSPCASALEAEAMRRLETEHPQSLVALRQPGCFPQNRSIAVAGIYRSGSTLLYNLVRLWAVLSQRPGTGGMVAGRRCTAELYPDARSNRISICKDHTLHASVVGAVGTVLMSRRTPAQSICSRKLEGQWCRWPDKIGGPKLKWNTPEWTAFVTECSTNKELEFAEVGRQCRDLMRLQADVYHGRHAAGGMVAFDSLLGDYTQDPTRQIRLIGQAIGICSQATANHHLLGLIAKLAANLRYDSAGNTDITFMHGTHLNKTERTVRCANIAPAVTAEPECAAWAAHSAAYTSNAVLHRMATLGLDSWSAASHTPFIAKVPV